MSSNRTILVTGATGFLGGRVAERLVAQGDCTVRVLVRSLSRAVRVASLPVEYHFGDVTDDDAFARAAAGCEAVIHCASRIEGGLSPEKTSAFLGVRSAAQACKAAGAKLIHISSCSVYGTPTGSIVDENSPMRPRHSKDTYARAKIAAELFLKDYAAAHGVRTAILQPTLIYGPHSEEWTLPPLAMLRTANVALPVGDTGLCNAVYVDDVVSAALRVLDKCDTRCPSYLINGDDLPSWADFFDRHVSLGTKGHVVRLTTSEVSALRREATKARSLIHTGMKILREQPDVRSAAMSTALVSNSFALVQKLVPVSAFHSIKSKLTGRKPAVQAPVIHFPQPPEVQTNLPPPHFLDLTRQCHRYTSARAKRELGYAPEFPLDRAFAFIGAWARWSQLV